VAAWLPKESLVQVPKVHRLDEKAHVIIMDDAGESSLTLKDFLKSGRLSDSTAVKIGESIGEFLGSLHEWGTAHRADCAIFEQHTEAPALAAGFYYGQLPVFFGGKSGVPFLEDPPLLLADERMAILKEIVTETIEAIISAKDHVRVILINSKSC